MSNTLVQLVNEWAAFEKEHQNPEIEDFCRFYLRQKEMKASVIPKGQNAVLVRVISRINAAFALYMRCALMETGLENIEGFPFLNALNFLGESKKTEVINYNLTEFSTGIDILNRLIAKGLLIERQDPEDKRSKLVKISDKGKTVLEQCYNKIGIAAEIMFADLSSQDKELCIQLLMPVEEKHTKIALDSKGKCLTELDQIANKVVNKKTKKAL